MQAALEDARTRGLTSAEGEGAVAEAAAPEAAAPEAAGPAGGLTGDDGTREAGRRAWNASGS